LPRLSIRGFQAAIFATPDEPPTIEFIARGSGIRSLWPANIEPTPLSVLKLLTRTEARWIAANQIARAQSVANIAKLP
jgi:hypothetical protein